MKLIGYAMAGVLAIVVIAGIAANHKNGSSPASPDASASAGSANITMIHGSSSDNSCSESDGEARIYVDITLRNSGDAAGTVNPWATFDYSDGGNSTESYASNWGHEFTVPAHSVRDATFYHTFNPQQHTMIRCSGYADLSTDAAGYFLPSG